MKTVCIHTNFGETITMSVSDIKEFKEKIVCQRFLEIQEKSGAMLLNTDTITKVEWSN